METDGFRNRQLEDEIGVLNSKLKVAVLLNEDITYIWRNKIICDKAFNIVREAFLDNRKMEQIGRVYNKTIQANTKH